MPRSTIGIIFQKKFRNFENILFFHTTKRFDFSYVTYRKTIHRCGIAGYFKDHKFLFLNFVHDHKKLLPWIPSGDIILGDSVFSTVPL